MGVVSVALGSGCAWGCGLLIHVCTYNGSVDVLIAHLWGIEGLVLCLCTRGTGLWTHTCVHRI